MKKLLLIGFLLIPHQMKSGMTEDYFNKLWSFFLIELGGTFFHECGHATFTASMGGIFNIYLGTTGKNHVVKNSDGKVTYVTSNPTCGFTRSRIRGEVSRIQRCEMAAFGPIYGMLYYYSMYKVIKILRHRFSPTLYESLRLFVLVQGIREFIYCAIPLSPISGDTGKLYTKSKLMRENTYNVVAAQNFAVLKLYARLCFMINCLAKVIHKLSNDSSIAAFKRDNATLLLAYKISSCYALQYGFLGTYADALFQGFKKKQIKMKKIKENEPSPLDWIGGFLISPLII